MSNNYTCFIDESGNTKELYWNEKGANFKTQPYFTLGLVAIKTEKISELESYVFRMKKQYNIQSDDPKGKDLYNTDKEYMNKILKFLLDNDVIIMCEITEKKYFLTSQICNFLLNATLAVEGVQQYLKFFADNLYKAFDDETYFLFCKLCRERTAENYYGFLNYCRIIIVEAKISALVDINIYDFFIDHLDEMINEKENFENYIDALPLIDINKNGKEWSSIPNIPALTNLIMRMNFLIKEEDPDAGVQYIHDEEHYLDEILRKNVLDLYNIKQSSIKDFLKSKKADSDFNTQINISFGVSKNQIGLQIADLVTGATMKNYLDYINKVKPLNEFAEHDKTVMEKLIFNFLNNINFVVPSDKADYYSTYLSFINFLK